MLERFLHDPEYPDLAGPLVDSHVHVFPPRVFDAIWRWFDTHAWPIRYRYHADEVCAYLRARGVEQFWALHYSHVPGMARVLNAFVTEVATREPALVPFGTVLPGEPEALAVVAESLDTYGHVGLKLHCHVQKFAPDDPVAFPIYEAVAARGKLIVLHAGREPASEAYGFDARAHCGAAAVRRVLERFPTLTLVVPHLGQDEWREFFALVREFPGLHLDTAMAVGGFLPGDVPTATDIEVHADRLLFGTDFPHLPFPWGRELSWLHGLGLSERALSAIRHGNARRLTDRLLPSLEGTAT